MSRIVVLGAGALGSVLGGRLSQSMPVVLVGRRPHLEAIQQRGLELLGPQPATLRTSERLRLAASPAEIDPPLTSQDLVLLTVKAAQVAEAMNELLSATPARDLCVFSFQNGTGFEEEFHRRLAERGSRGRHAVSHVGANWVGPGRVEDWGGEILLPEDPPGRHLAEALRSSGLGAQLRPALEPDRWAKIAFNCALNPMAALLEVRNRETLLPELRPLRRGVIEEVRSEALAAGIHLPETEKLLVEFERRAGASNNLNSMLQDLRQGRPTEMPFLNRAIERRARARGARAPLNDRLACWIERLEGAEREAQAGLRVQALTELRAAEGAA